MPQTPDLAAAVALSAENTLRALDEVSAALDANDINDARAKLSLARVQFISDRDIVQAYADLPRAEKVAANGLAASAKGGKNA